MENLAEELLQKTGTAVVVATVKTVGDNDPDTYANELYASWGIGKKGEDKGVLMFLAVEERKIRIETGYGVEGILPDGLVGSILDQYVVPYLRQNDYGKGLLNGMLAVGQVIAKDAGVTLGDGYQPMPAKRQRKQGGLGLLPILFFFIFFFIIVKTAGRHSPLVDIDGHVRKRWTVWRWIWRGRFRRRIRRIRRRHERRRRGEQGVLNKLSALSKQLSAIN